MPNFNSIINNNQPIIQALIFDPSEPREQDPKKWEKNSCVALVDTGATKSVVTSKVVDRLGLIPQGKTKITSASHIVDANLYHILVGIPVAEIQDPVRGIQNIHAKFFPLQVTEMPDLGQDFDMLIGMDIIQQCLLIVHQNSLIFSF